MKDQTTIEQLVRELKVMRSLQMRFWSIPGNRPFYYEQRRQLLQQCKMQERLVDNLIREYESNQLELGL